MKVIDIARDFSPYPGGRYPDDGPANGTDFRNNFLVPILEDGAKARIILDGAKGYPSSFLEEAFGGLVRLGYDATQVLDSFEFIATQPGYKRFVDTIRRYVQQAAA